MPLPSQRGSDALRNVLAFTCRHWARRWPMAAGIGAAIVLATLTEIFLPLYAGRLIDALTAGKSEAPAALEAFIMMAGLGLVMVLLRHLAWWGVVPLTLGMMSVRLRVSLMAAPEEIGRAPLSQAAWWPAASRPTSPPW